MLAPDQINVVYRTRPRRFDHLRHKLHQPARLPVALVLLEERNHMLHRGVKRVGTVDIFRNLFRALRYGFRPHRLRDRGPIRSRHRIDHILLRQLLEKPLPQNVVNLVASQINRRHPARLPVRLLRKIPNRGPQLSRSFLVSSRKIREHNATAFQLQRSGKKIRKRVGRHLRQRPAPHHPCHGVIEIRRQFVQQK